MAVLGGSRSEDRRIRRRAVDRDAGGRPRTARRDHLTAATRPPCSPEGDLLRERFGSAHLRWCWFGIARYRSNDRGAAPSPLLESRLRRDQTAVVGDWLPAQTASQAVRASPRVRAGAPNRAQGVAFAAAVGGVAGLALRSDRRPTHRVAAAGAGAVVLGVSED